MYIRPHPNKKIEFSENSAKRRHFFMANEAAHSRPAYAFHAMTLPNSNAVLASAMYFQYAMKSTDGG